MTRLFALGIAVLLSLAVACGDDDKKKMGESCDDNADCADEVCHHGCCMTPDPGGAGAPCTGPWECKSLSCAAGKCGPGNKAAWGKDHYLMVWSRNKDIQAARFK